MVQPPRLTPRRYAARPAARRASRPPQGPRRHTHTHAHTTPPRCVALPPSCRVAEMRASCAQHARNMRAACGGGALPTPHPTRGPTRCPALREACTHHAAALCCRAAALPSCRGARNHVCAVNIEEMRRPVARARIAEAERVGDVKLGVLVVGGFHCSGTGTLFRRVHCGAKQRNNRMGRASC